MKIRFNCDNCGAIYHTDSANAGKRGKCKKCGSIIICPGINHINDDAWLNDTIQGGIKRNVTNESTHKQGRSRLILIFGILGIFPFGPILGIPAWIMGYQDLKKIKSGILSGAQKRTTHNGMILGVISTFLFIVVSTALYANHYSVQDIVNKVPLFDFLSRERADWKKTVEDNSITAYKNFMKAYPNSKNSEEVKNIIENLEWSEAFSSKNDSILKSCVLKYPNSGHLSEALKIIEELEWKRAFETKNDSLIRYCMETYPHSPNIEESKHLLSQIRWPIIIVKKVMTVQIWSNGRGRNYGWQVYSIGNALGGFTGQMSESDNFTPVVIWRNFTEDEIENAEKMNLLPGVAYLKLGDSGYRYVKKVNLEETDTELAKEFGVDD
jgi:hypothetical protein